MDKIIPFEKSFASVQKSIFWSKKNTVLPKDVYKSSPKKYVFDCSICNHEFIMALNNISRRGSWCSFCSNTYLCDKDICSICFDKSFASNPKSIYWSSKNIISPNKVFKSSNVEYLFDCSVCGHEFLIKLSSITNLNSWCYFCYFFIVYIYYTIKN